MAESLSVPFYTGSVNLFVPFSFSIHISHLWAAPAACLPHPGRWQQIHLFSCSSSSSLLRSSSSATGGDTSRSPSAAPRHPVPTPPPPWPWLLCSCVMYRKVYKVNVCAFLNVEPGVFPVSFFVFVFFLKFCYFTCFAVALCCNVWHLKCDLR